MSLSKQQIDALLGLASAGLGAAHFFGQVDDQTYDEVKDGLTYLQRNDAAVAELEPKLMHLIEVNKPLVLDLLNTIRKFK